MSQDKARRKPYCRNKIPSPDFDLKLNDLNIDHGKLFWKGSLLGGNVSWSPAGFFPQYRRWPLEKNGLTGRAMVAHSGQIIQRSQLRGVGGAIRAANQPNVGGARVPGESDHSDCTCMSQPPLLLISHVAKMSL